MDFIDLHKRHKEVEGEIISRIKELIKKGNFILGEGVSSFESEFSDYLGSKYCAGVNSGTDALYLALRALGVKNGDEVITTPFTMMASVECIVRCGATPVFVDINENSYNIDLSKIESAITEKTKALVAVHMFGNPINMEVLISIANKNKIAIVEDVAQATGAKYNNRYTGTFGDAGCFSFFPTKNLGCFGDGGAVISKEEKIDSMVKVLRAHGSVKKYTHEYFGLNSRLDAIQAGILSVSLKKLAEWNERRREHAEYYSKGLKNVGDIILPTEEVKAYHVYHQYTIRTNQREKLKSYLSELGIPTMVYYPLPIHLQPVLEYLNYSKGIMPVAEKATEEVLSIPISPELTDSDRNKIIKSIRIFYDKK